MKKLIVLLIILLLILTSKQPQPQVVVQQATTFRLFIPGVVIQRNNKRGVSAPASCAEIQRLQVSWTYTYYPITQGCAGVENVPMIQAENQMRVPVIANSEWLLGFNEPDILGWARQSPTEAAINWKAIEERYPSHLLVSPVPGSFMTYDELGWLKRFRAEFIALFGFAPRFDALGVHIYFVSAQDAINVVKQAIELAKSWDVAGVWVTEFGLPSGECGNQSELGELVTFLTYLDRTPEVMRYAHFGARFDVSVPESWYPSDWCDLTLVRLGGELTPYGKVYSGVK